LTFVPASRACIAEQLELIRRQHKKTVDALNDVVQNDDHSAKFDNQPLEKVIKATHLDATQRLVYNFASQHWNMCFFMRSLEAAGEDHKNGAMQHVAQALGRYCANYKSMSEWEKKVKDEIVLSFGSGWVWLTVDQDKKLRVLSTLGADTPMLAGLVPLLGISVWEHAYLLDYSDDKEKYAEAVWKAVNWRFVDSVVTLLKTTNRPPESPSQKVAAAAQPAALAAPASPTATQRAAA